MSTETSQESFSIPSTRLRNACLAALGSIYDIRAQAHEQLVEFLTEQENRRWWRKWFGKTITPQDMDEQVASQYMELTPEQRQVHPATHIQLSYQGLEQTLKDVLILCQHQDRVTLSMDTMRGLSHLGVSEELRPVGFGFLSGRGDGP
jgi:hypothetical protein